MKGIYKVYRNRLVEITGKSRSLYSRNASSKQAYNLGRLFDRCPLEAEAFRDFLFHGGAREFELLTDAQLAPILGVTKVDRLVASQKQRLIESETRSFVQLSREIDEIFRDTGRYELFVGYPFVEGKIGKNIVVKAPLLLFPAKISTEKGVEIVVLKDEPVQLNKVFLLAYSRELRLNVENIVTDFEDFSERFSSIEAVRDYLASQGVKLKYSAPKKVITNIEAEAENLAELEIKHHCVLGRFPLANSIYYDYNELFRRKLSCPALETLLGNKEPKLRDKKTPDAFFVASLLDFAQSEAVEKCDSGRHMVIYGPPGTGKSQTIAAIIIDNICKDRRALVVSQKRAALDVVYNRLGNINSKAIILPDPEKNKNEFYSKVRARYDEIMSYRPQFDEAAYKKCCSDLASEVAELRAINDVLFTPTAFGLNLQSMYTLSSNIGKNSGDYATYTAMLKSDIMRLSYEQLSGACRSIAQRGKGKLFYEHITRVAESPLIDYIKTDIDVHTLGQVKAFLAGVINKERVPFNVAGFAYSRYLMVYNLELYENKSLKPLADMITRSENPRLYNALRATYIPPMWLGYPFAKRSYSKKRRAIFDKLLTAENAVKHFVGEFDLLRGVLEPQGLAMVVDSIAYGNDQFLKQLLTALDDYVSIRTIQLALKSITKDEKLIIDFAYSASGNQTEFYEILQKVLPLRIYHEVVENERKKEPILSKTIIYEDIRKSILSYKDSQKKMVGLLALDNYNQACKDMFAANPEKTNNFLHQIGKQRGLWPVRRLIEHFEEFLLEMFPIWLLSPEAVSSVMPLKEGLFDIVLFDEASQLFIESTIPAIYRGKSLVVAGDNKQLRPTSVFVKRYMGDDTYDAETSLNTQALMEVESLLDLASSRLKATHLTYHYRSRHEELINFSNYAFYGGRLQIAPNVSKNRDYLAIERIKTDGKWIGRRNEAEAREVVRLVRHILKNRTAGETIGIVTFNTEQEEYIKDLLDKECRICSEFKSAYHKELNRIEDGEDNSLFVKNLENVQGDERDIIIFSVAYARNEEGRLASQFGTLSLSGGENRLNVAITRAVKKVYLVCSVEPEEFVNVSSSKNDGPKLLIKYMQYARAVTQRNESDVKQILSSLSPAVSQASDEAGDFESSLKTEIEKMGYRVDVNLGNAEYKITLAIYDEELDRYLLGLECDYTAFSSSPSMLERDVYRLQFLASRGWDIMRIWSRDWWLNKQSLLKQIENRLMLNRKTELAKQVEAPKALSIKENPTKEQPTADKQSKKEQPTADKQSKPTIEKSTKEKATAKKSPAKSAVKETTATTKKKATTPTKQSVAKSPATKQNATKPTTSKQTTAKSQATKQTSTKSTATKQTTKASQTTVSKKAELTNQLNKSKVKTKATEETAATKPKKK